MRIHATPVQRFLGRTGQGLAGGLAGVAGVVWVCHQVPRVNTATVGFALLTVVLAVATARGLAAAVAASVAAMLSFNYFFLPPVGQFTIADPENWVALGTFLLTALVASHLSEQARQKAQEAVASQRETEQLYALSHAILLTDRARPMGAQVAQCIARIFDAPGVLLRDAAAGETHRGGAAEWDLIPVTARLAEVARTGQAWRGDGIAIWPVALGGHPIGALALAEWRGSDGAVQSMLNLTAIALERVRTEEATQRAEAARQSEEFKSMLLDAMAHEFKTPLTSIKAAVTALRLGQDRLAEDQRELASIIEEETDRVDALVTDAVKMAEINAHRARPRRIEMPVADLLARARASFAGRGDERVQVTPAAGTVQVDAELLVLALRQLIDNALKYAGPHSPVNCMARERDGQVVLEVADQGPGIPERERERVFEKFFRREQNAVPGTGLGLHIAREIARIHGGDLWVEQGRPAGAVFCLALPRGTGAA